MSYFQALARGIALVMFAAFGLAQSTGTWAESVVWISIAFPGRLYPANPLEMVTGNAEPVQLLSSARRQLVW